MLIKFDISKVCPTVLIMVYYLPLKEDFATLP